MKKSTKIILGGIAAMSLLPSIAFKNKDTYDAFITEASKKHNVPFVIIKALIAAESSFRADAKAGTTSATGLMQMTKGAAQDVGYDHNAMTDPQTAIMAGTAYLARHINKFGLIDGIRAYYAGWGNATKKTGKHWDDSLEYVTKIMTYAAAFSLDIKTWV